MNLTANQQAAITARGNVLMVAGAGTGKTTTLVQRCLHCLLGETPVATLEEILMVTFTDASAVDMRRRIREALELEKLKPSNKEKAERLREQLALFDTAHIGTLHGFCLQLVRQHFYELGLDPQLTVMPEEDAKLLADETLGKILEDHYAGANTGSEAVRQLIQTQARGWDLPIRSLVLKLHHYTQTLRNPQDWLTNQMRLFNSPDPDQWQVWLLEGILDWRNRWLPILHADSAHNKKAAQCADILETMDPKTSAEECASVLRQIKLADADWPKGKKLTWRKPIKDFFDEASFFNSLAQSGSLEEPLRQDWNWVRPQMTTLLKLAAEFTAAFSLAKRELGTVDFHDLEQHTLRLLWEGQQPTKTALEWRCKLRFVFVDEYQDINEAQDAILQALSGEHENANRFLVGDVKQSIYRFRLADPRIFQHYADTWHGEKGRVIPLVENFRSREAILNFVNSLFGGLMRREIGGVAYGEDARLLFGDAAGRNVLGMGHDASPRVELHLRLKGGGDSGGTDGEKDATSPSATDIMNLEEAAKEARLVALRLREMKSSGHLVWDETAQIMRPVEWSDMIILLRSPSGRVETYAREFTRLGVPLMVSRGGFYQSLEVTDLLSLLQALDNPLQDLPVLAVLRSPLVGMTIDELATIRLMLPQAPYWMALRHYHEMSREHSGWSKADRFLKNFAAWRRLARQVSLSRCLEAVLEETFYAAWLATQPRGELRQANVQRLLALARQFDQFQRQGLFRFLGFIEAQQSAQAEPHVAALSGENSVSLMSIHQSKGLEFPVVVVADLGKAFNLSDLWSEIILDSEYGLCPQIKPPHTGQSYPSLPYFLARQRQKRELLGEEMRLLYVAMTRARDTLVLAGSVGEKRFHQKWFETPSPASILQARGYLDWLAAWSASNPQTQLTPSSGENTFWRWTIYDEFDKRLLEDPSPASKPDAEKSSDNLDALSEKKLRQHLEWDYPHIAATLATAKTSVTLLRRRSLEDNESEAPPLFKFATRDARPPTQTGARILSAAEIGTAHHIFLQYVSLEKAGTMGGLQTEARRMELEEILTAGQCAHLDFASLMDFWQSLLGKEIRTHAKNVRREFAFTARFSPAELPGYKAENLPENEFVVVQGVTDLVVLLPEEIWLVDFKTDQMAMAGLPEKVRFYETQLRLYAMALERIYQRPASRIYLHFLTLRQSVAVKPEKDSPFPVPQTNGR